MIGWLVIAFVVLALFVYFKIGRFRHSFRNAYIVFVVLLLLFLFLSAASIVSKNKIDLTSASGIAKAVKLYFLWMGNLFENTRSIAGNVIKLNWNVNGTG